MRTCRLILVALAAVALPFAVPVDARSGHEPTLTQFFLDNPLPVGSHLVRAFVTPYGPGDCQIPTGVMTFRVNGQVQAVGPVVSFGSDATLTFDDPGRYVVRVTYSGDGNCARSHDQDRREVVDAR